MQQRRPVQPKINKITYVFVCVCTHARIVCVCVCVYVYEEQDLEHAGVRIPALPLKSYINLASYLTTLCLSFLFKMGTVIANILWGFGED